MKFSPRPAASGFRAFLTLSLLLLALGGCGRHVSRPASTLSEKDRMLLDRYEDIRVALAKDDLRSVKRAGSAMNAYLKKTPDATSSLASNSESIGSATALDRARVAFEPLSANIVKLVDGVEGYYIFDTPIPDGAQWVQKTPETDNPYTGRAMHDIGTLRK